MKRGIGAVCMGWMIATTALAEEDVAANGETAEDEDVALLRLQYSL